MDNNKIGSRLRALRGEKSAEIIAKELGISVSALFMYERGERIPRDQIKLRLASYYGTTVQDIFFTE